MPDDRNRPIEPAKRILADNAHLRPLDKPLMIFHDWEMWYANYGEPYEYTPLGVFGITSDILEARICEALRSEDGSDVKYIHEYIDRYAYPTKSENAQLPDEATFFNRASSRTHPARWEKLEQLEEKEDWFPATAECNNHSYNYGWCCLDGSHILALLKEDTVAECAEAVLSQNYANGELLREGLITGEYDQETWPRIRSENNNTSNIYFACEKQKLHSLNEYLYLCSNHDMIGLSLGKQAAGHGYDPFADATHQAWTMHAACEVAASQWLAAIACSDFLRNKDQSFAKDAVCVSRTTQQRLLRSLPILTISANAQHIVWKHELEVLYKNLKTATPIDAQWLSVSDPETSVDLAHQALGGLVNKIRLAEMEAVVGPLGQLMRQPEWRIETWQAQAEESPDKARLWIGMVGYEPDRWALCALPPRECDKDEWMTSSRANTMKAMSDTCEVPFIPYEDRPAHLPKNPTEMPAQIEQSAIVVYDDPQDAVDAALRLGYSWHWWTGRANGTWKWDAEGRAAQETELRATASQTPKPLSSELQPS